MNLRIFLVAVNVVFFALTAVALEGPVPTAFEAQMYGYVAQLNDHMLRSCADCTTADDAGADMACRSQYGSVFSKDEISLHVAFGYMDASETPGGGRYGGQALLPNQSIDPIASEGLIQQLTLACHRNQGACGFTRDPNNSELLYKSVRVNGRRVGVSLRITRGSETPFLSDNLGAAADAQNSRTARSEVNFFGSLGASDLTIYMGHARSGGGPDFSPPILLADLTPNYPLYRKQKPGLNKLLTALKKTSSHPAVLALLGCKSDPLFRKPLLSVDPKLGLITLPDLTYFEDGFQETYLVLDAFLRRECAGAFHKTLNQVDSGIVSPNIINFL
jgi:hypothetical protein